MVRGRLPRESNPVPGQSQPGFVPAFDETGNEDYVRVSNQKPYPVANYTQNASGVWLPTSQNNPMPTQLTGSNVEEEVFPRGVRGNQGDSKYLTAPKGAIGFRAELTVHGVTGVFENGQGINLQFWDRTAKKVSFTTIHSTRKTNGSINRSQHVITTYPGLTTEPYEENFLQVSTIIGTILRLQIQIDGTFSEDEGFDCELHVRWLF